MLFFALEQRLGVSWDHSLKVKRVFKHCTGYLFCFLARMNMIVLFVGLFGARDKVAFDFGGIGFRQRNFSVNEKVKSVHTILKCNS